MNLNYCLDNEYFSLWEMVLQDLEADRFPTHEGTYVDISWHKMRRRCTWLWGCAPAEKTWGCTQTAEGTGSRTPRCRWNWCTPAEKAHHPGQLRTASRLPDAWGGVIFSQHPPRGIFISVTFWMAQPSLSSPTSTPNGREIGPPIQRRDVNGEMFSHKPLMCLVATQAETAVIELGEPLCELLLQYRNCVTVSGW